LLSRRQLTPPQTPPQPAIAVAQQFSQPGNIFGEDILGQLDQGHQPSGHRKQLPNVPIHHPSLSTTYPLPAGPGPSRWPSDNPPRCKRQRPPADAANSANTTPVGPTSQRSPAPQSQSASPPYWAPPGCEYQNG